MAHPRRFGPPSSRPRGRPCCAQRLRNGRSGHGADRCTFAAVRRPTAAPQQREDSPPRARPREADEATSSRDRLTRPHQSAGLARLPSALRRGWAPIIGAFGRDPSLGGRRGIPDAEAGPPRASRCSPPATRVASPIPIGSGISEIPATSFAPSADCQCCPAFVQLILLSRPAHSRSRSTNF